MADMTSQEISDLKRILKFYASNGSYIQTGHQTQPVAPPVNTDRGFLARQGLAILNK